ncbi:hypothetical protein [Halosolutus gelatinilyticus]|uniref:hypothetical protein n=1 Tax=Halosolutus gelatinilyticus TaxID=2931975 RepID=UPI001FF445B4|nr:hypothetical protein [Halosolutus gelatinilyticus]
MGINGFLPHGRSSRSTLAYEDVVIYDGADADDVLYEGPILVHPNGWLELEGNRLLSPGAVHHIDIYDDVALDEGADERGRGDRGTSDRRGAADRRDEDRDRWGVTRDRQDDDRDRWGR